MNKLKLWTAVLAALLLFAGCKDLFHPDWPKEEPSSGTYTVTFNADGGSPASQTRQVSSGGSVGYDYMPSEPFKDGYSFGGWYTERNGQGTQFYYSTVVTGNITVYAKWTSSIYYTVTFDADGGTPASRTRQVSSGSSVGYDNMPSEPSKGGYTFGGWYTERNGQGTQFYSNTTVTTDTTVYARWTSSSSTYYTVTFDADGGSPANQNLQVNDGGSVGYYNMPSEPTKGGYTFGGWYTDRYGGGSQFTYETTVTGDIIVYAKWNSSSSTEYTVTFDADGGSPASQILQVNDGSSVGYANMPSEPSKGGYTFGGWYTDRYGMGTQFYSTTPVTADIMVYAKWTLYSSTYYTVTFDADGGSPASQSLQVNDGSSVSYYNMLSEPSKNGDVFGGWYTERYGGGSQFTYETTVTADITVYARWNSSSSTYYTVTFDADGGSPETQTRSVSSGGSVGYDNMPSEPSNGGYVFGGWYTERDGGGEPFNHETTVTWDITVYAKWSNYLPDNLSLDESLTWISSNAVEGGDYFIVLKNDETIDPRSLYNNYGYGQINITLTGDTAERTVSLNTTGSLFTVGSGVTLTLGNNVTLLGRSDNYSPLVTVDWIGALIMNSGSKITGNTNNSWSSGGGVNVFGTFTMNGGEITGNRVEYGGGGVYVPGGTFIKQAEAVIYGSNADASLKNTAVSGGGHAAYVAISPEKTRNTTASAGVTLDSSLSGVTGGWVDAEITAFNIGAVVGTFNGTNITLVISYSNSSEISSLMPTITLSLGAAVSPASLEAQNFSSAVQYTVTAEDGSILVYTVTIKNSRARLMSFNFSEPAATGIIDEGAKTISVTVPYNTDPGTLVPEITLSPNATVNPASGEARNFSSPAAYTVTAEDGTVMVYTVTVTPKGQGSVTLVYPDDAAGGDLALTGIVISKPGGKETLQASGEFDSYRWRVDGVIRWNGKSFTLDADHYTIGGHRISLEVTRGGVAYSKSGSFIVQ